MRHPIARHAMAFALALAVFAEVPPAGAAPHLVRVLPNKATLILRENRTRPVVTVQVWVRAGTRDESRPERGAASVLAELPWAGSTTRTQEDVEETIDLVGGTHRSEAGVGHILYEVTVPSGSFETAAKLLGDVVAHPRFEGKPLEDAKSSARTRSRNALGHAALASMNPLVEALHPGTPLGAPRAVPEREIGLLTSTLVSRFHETWFVGGNVMIVVVGDVAPDVAERTIRDAFSGIPRKDAPRRSRVNERPLDKTQVIGATNPEGAGGAALTIGFRAPAWGTADALALDALIAMLADYGDARLQRRLGEGTIVGASAHRSFEADGGTVAFSMTAAPEELKDAEMILFGEIARARFTPVDPDEFQRTIETILARDLTAQDDFSGVGRATAITAMQGLVGGDEVYAARLRALKPEDLVAVARQYLDPKGAVVVEMAPKEYVDSLRLYQGLEARVLENLTLAGSTYSKSGPMATASDAGDRRRRVDEPLRSIPREPRDAGRGFVNHATAAGGIRVLSSEERGPDVATVAVYLEGSVRWEREGNNGITTLLRETLLTSADPKAAGRAYRFSLLDLGRLTPYQDRDMWGYSLTVPSDRWKEALARLGAMMSHPELDSVTVDATRLLVLDQQARWENDDAARRRQLIFTTRYKVSGYGLPLLGSQRSIVMTRYKDVEAFYRRFVVKPNLVVAVFGNVNADEVGPAVAEAFRDVPEGPFDPGTPVKEGRFDGFREEWELGEGDESTVSLAFDGPPASSPEVPVMYVISSLFSNPRGWFKTFIREKSVGVTVTDSYVAHAIDECPIVATVAVKGPDLEEQTVKMLFGQFRSTAAIQLTGPFAQDFQDAREHASGGFQMSQTTCAARAFQWARAEVFHLPHDYVAAFPGKLLAVTPEEIRGVAFEYFQYPTAGKRPYAICETRPGGW